MWIMCLLSRLFIALSLQVSERHPGVKFQKGSSRSEACSGHPQRPGKNLCRAQPESGWGTQQCPAGGAVAAGSPTQDEDQCMGSPEGPARTAHHQGTALPHTATHLDTPDTQVTYKTVTERVVLSASYILFCQMGLSLIVENVVSGQTLFVLLTYLRCGLPSTSGFDMPTGLLARSP